jgi:hypothetical protein
MIPKGCKTYGSIFLIHDTDSEGNISLGSSFSEQTMLLLSGTVEAYKN